MKELSYVNEDGNTVHTSQYLKNRKSCCKSACLHCPYGHTLNQFGLEFRSLTERDYSLANQILQENSKTGVADSLLSSAFGGKQTKAIDSSSANEYLIVLLKNFVCGLFQPSSNELFLLKYFQEQGITKDLVVSSFSQKNS